MDVSTAQQEYDGAIQAAKVFNRTRDTTVQVWIRAGGYDAVDCQPGGWLSPDRAYTYAQALIRASEITLRVQRATQALIAAKRRAG